GVHGALAHTAGADILRGLERHFEGEIFPPPDPELADRLALAHRRRHRAVIDDAGENPLAAVARDHHPDAAGPDQRNIASAAAENLGFADRLSLREQKP